MGMRRFSSLFLQNLWIEFKEARRNMLLVLVPVVVFFFVYIYFSVNEVAGDYVSPIKMAVIDLDDTTYSDMLVESFRSNESFSRFVTVAEGDDNALLEAFEERQVDVLITVPKGFIEGLSTEEALPLDVKINYDDPIKAILFKNVISSYEKYIRSIETSVLLIDYEMWELGVSNESRWSWRDRSLVNLVFVSLGRQTFFESKPIIDVPTVAAVKYYFIALMVLFLMYISVFAAISLVREKETMCLNRLRVSSTTMITYMFAKGLAIAVYIFAVVWVWFMAYRVFYGPLWQANGFLIWGFLFLSILFNVSLAMFFTVFFDSIEPVILLSSVFIFFNGVIGGSIIPIHSMPLTIQRMANLSPSYWMIRGFLYLDFSYHLGEIGLVAIGLLLMALMLTLLTGFLYGREAV